MTTRIAKSSYSKLTQRGTRKRKSKKGEGEYFLADPPSLKRNSKYTGKAEREKLEGKYGSDPTGGRSVTHWHNRRGKRVGGNKFNTKALSKATQKKTVMKPRCPVKNE